jgi:hypothetical protein
MPKQPKTLSPPVLAELVTGKMEFNLKMNELPIDIEILENKWVAFVIDTEPEQVKVAILLRFGKRWQSDGLSGLGGGEVKKGHNLTRI